MKLKTVGPLETLPDREGYLFRSGAYEIALFRSGESVSALENGCPHAGASLCSGFSDGKIVVCPWHGWEFEIESGKGLSVEGIDAETFRVVVEDGIVKVELPD
ncbi:assimilatory nitrite reductase (NAD(P)H) small subunit [Abditibacterium utsteinense]|uniref:Assimilatory nitrite reductase (NAD(P)H) small subunit n=1 Tax=Abditibacterium utsteinense TaxID=1960156 RepID=A0A2S8SUV6_9BACT|nr:Rieske (2Fe-2S) protein [Abditibacterium utsteinense]PQV64572.1 assimilatory nitrite reductase (NAD(P)H) small subunit [Abditibacterium utsteinense]